MKIWRISLGVFGSVFIGILRIWACERIADGERRGGFIFITQYPEINRAKKKASI